MHREPLINVTSLIDALPGWICVVGGAVLLAMFAWTPQWLACRETAWQRDLMQAQARALTEQHDRYVRFETALAQDDPILIERLAFTELRHKRVGQQLAGAEPDLLLAANPQFIPDDTHLTAPASPATTRPGAFHAWLREPMPVVGQTFPALPAVQSHLTRIVTGPWRLPAILFAVGVMTMGILMQVRSGGPSAATPPAQ